MKRLLPLLVLIAIAAPGVFAQGTYTDTYSSDHVNVGVFGDFFRLNDGNINFLGLGARFGANVNPYVQLEAESNYDFRQEFSEVTNNGTGGTTVTNSNVRVLHFHVRPKVPDKPRAGSPFSYGEGRFHKLRL
jgi:hypothetical protein